MPTSNTPVRRRKTGWPVHVASFLADAPATNNAGNVPSQNVNIINAPLAALPLVAAIATEL